VTGLTYSTYVTQIAEMAVVDPLDVNFVTILPAMIDYAELRIYRDLDLASTSFAYVDPAIRVNSASRNITVPVPLANGGSFMVSEQINLILPAGETDPDASGASRVQLLPTTKEYLDAVYGSNVTAARGVPAFYAPLDQNSFYVGPFSNNTYYCEVVGTYRPAAMSVSNPVTYISQFLPDLLIMASMVYISAYQRNFGRQSDDPQMAQSYESQYMTLLRSAGVEEARKKYEGPAWSSQSPTPIATPTRG
jgi:hypothetical protein